MKRRKGSVVILFCIVSLVVMCSASFVLANDMTEAERNSWFKKAAAPYRGESVDILFTSGFRFDKSFQLAGREFEKITGIKMNVKGLKWEEMHDQVMASYVAHTSGSNLVLMDGWLIPVLFGSGSITCLDPYLKRSDITYPDLDFDDFVKNDIKFNCTWPIGESIYALPYFPDVHILVYNTEYFAKLGLTVPETWEEFGEVIKKFHLKDLNGDGKPEYGNAAPAGKNPDLPAFFQHRYASFGGEWFDENFLPAFNNEIGLKAMELMRSHLKYAAPGSVGWDYGMVRESFIRGEAAIAELATDIPLAAEDPIASKIVGKCGIAQLPRGVRYAPLYGGWSLGIPTYAKNHELSYLLMQWITEKRMMKKEVLELGLPQSRRSVLNDPEVRSKFPWYSVLLDSLEMGYAVPKIPEVLEIWDTYMIHLSRFTSGAETGAKKVLQDMYDAIYNTMEKGGYYE